MVSLNSPFNFGFNEPFLDGYLVVFEELPEIPLLNAVVTAGKAECLQFARTDPFQHRSSAHLAIIANEGRGKSRSFAKLISSVHFTSFTLCGYFVLYVFSRYATLAQFFDFLRILQN